MNITEEIIRETVSQPDGRLIDSAMGRYTRLYIVVYNGKLEGIIQRRKAGRWI
jgi:hypothetical protein